MDSHTLGLLDFDKIRQTVAQYAASPLGRELASQIEPKHDHHVINKELNLVSEMVVAFDLGQEPQLTGLHDIRLFVRRAAIGTMLSAEQLLKVAETLNCTGACYRYRMKLDEQFTGLNELLSGVEDLGTVGKTIFGCIDGRGHVLDMASRELAAIRQQLFELDEKVKAEVKRLLRDPELRKILSYPNATVNGDHYVLPVSVNHRHKVPGVVHRVSGTGETVFVEPASIAKLSAERITLKSDEEREIKRILRRLSTEVGRVAKPLNYALDVIAKLDLITAKARYSRDFHMTKPELNGDNRLWLRDARHPILEQIIRNAPSETRTIVPIEVRLGVGFNLLIITGPNTGGKTVALKTTALICLMAQSALHIPCGAGSTVPILDHIYADIGDEQSLEQSLSTFSSHISRMATIFETANAKSLILLDELGAGTDPTEGAALGRAILDHLDSIGCLAIVTTHLGDLKTYAFNNDNAENGAVEFNIETLRPTYRLMIGQFGMSNALKIAKRLKLPKSLLNQAHHYLRKRKGKGPELSRLQELREEAEKARAAALAAEHSANQRQQELEQQKAAVEQDARRELELRKFRHQLKTNDTVHVSRFDATGKVVRVNLLKETVIVSVGIGQWEVPFAEVLPKA